MPPTIVIKIRITADSFTQAEQASAELRAQLGTARVMLEKPREGRDKQGDGNPPWFVYGTFQFVPEAENDFYRPPPAQRPGLPKIVAVPTANTGQTQRLTPPAKAKKPPARPKPKPAPAGPRRVHTPSDLLGVGIELGYDVKTKRYYAHYWRNPKPGYYSYPYDLKRDAEAEARRWMANFDAGKPLPAQLHSWKPSKPRKRP